MSSSSLSSSVVPQYCPNLSVLRELILSEKENTRRWLRAEMDRFVDPMIDSIFDKITNKLVGSGYWGGCYGLNCAHTNPSHLIQTFDHAESSIPKIHQPPSLIYQPSTSVISTSVNPEFLQQHPTGGELEQKILAKVKREIKEKNEMTMKNVMDNTFSQQIKEEFDKHEKEVREGMIHKVNHIPQHIQPRKVKTRFPSTDHHMIKSMPKPQLNVTTEEGSKIKKEFDDEANNHGGIVEIKKEEKDGYGETRLNDIAIEENFYGGQMIKIKKEEEGGGDPETSRSVENVTIEASQPHPFGQSDMLTQMSEKSTKRKKTHDKHAPSKVNNRNDHKKEYYDEEEATLRSVERPRLSCPTTSSSTQETHYAKQHRPTFNCQHSGCVYQTSTPSMLKRHQLTHLDMKPYRCKWPGCDYTAVQKGQTIVHICVKHLAPNPGSVPNGTQLVPKDYLEVVHDL